MDRRTHTTPPLNKLMKWSVVDVACAMLAEEENGGLGFSQSTVEKFAKLKVRGVTILKFIEGLKPSDDRFSELIDEYVYAGRWFQKRMASEEVITVEVSLLDWFICTGTFEEETLPTLIDQIVDSIQIDFEENRYHESVQREISNINQSMGNIGTDSEEWPVIMYKSAPKLDWRFSTHILSSTEEVRTIQQFKNGRLASLFDKPNRYETSVKDEIETSQGENMSIHEFIAHEIHQTKESKIFVLLALSGAGKSHSLFYLNTSNTAFTLPIDFGSVEDKPVLLYESYDYIGYQVKRLKPNENMNEEIEKENRVVVNNIQAEIATLFSLRGLMLLHLLRKRKTLTPSMWIRYLYNGGSSEYKTLYSEWNVKLRGLNKNVEFLKHLLILLNTEIQENTTAKSKRMVLSVDEINPLVLLGGGNNRISFNAGNTIGSGSVASILFRLLGKCSAVSVVSGTKTDTSILQLVVASNRPLKNTITLIPYYGPTSLKQLKSFTAKYFNAPLYSDVLFNACCTILQGRRRAFMKFLTEIVGNVKQNPYPVDEKKVDSWKHKIILNAFEKYPPNEFLEDINNFFNENDHQYSNYNTESLKKTRIDVSLFLVLQNNLQSTDLDEIIQNHFGSGQDQLRESILLSIIFHGISFAKSIEIVNAIHLNAILRSNFERAKELVSVWLSNAFKDNHKDKKMDKNQVLSKLFEMIGAMILLDIGQTLQGKPITTHELFKDKEGTFLDSYTLPSSLSIVNNKNYWRVFEIFKKWNNNSISSLFRDVVAFGLDEGLKVDVKTLLIPIVSSQPIRELNMTSKFISSSEHYTEFKNNFYGSDYRHTFLCNDWKTVKPKLEKKRKEFENIHTNEEGQQFEDTTLRILFDYTFENIQLFNEEKEKITTGDVVVLFSKANDVFLDYFKTKFPSIYSVLNEFGY